MNQLKDVMTKDVEIINPMSSLFECAEKMKRFNIGVLPVCDGRKVQGIITDRDIVVRAIADHRDLSSTRAVDIMSRDIEFCHEEDSVKDAAELMQEKQLRRLIVVDRDKNLVGIVSIGDFAVKTGKESLAGETLEEISKGGRTGRGIGPKLGVASSIGLVLGGLLLIGAFYVFRGEREVELPSERIAA